MSIAPEAVNAAAARLIEAAATGRPCSPVRDLLAGGSIDDAYAVQQAVAAATGDGRRVVGRKIGLTSRAVQLQMGVDQPDFGLLYGDMAFGDSEPIPLGRLLQPRVEAEVAFVLGKDLPERPVGVADVLAATDFVVAAIEVVDSRIEEWDISILDTVADNASSGLFVLGGAPRSLRAVPDLRDCHMTLRADEAEVSRGSGSDCLGHPVNAVVWLANALLERGTVLRSGDTVLSGSLGPLVRVEAAGTFEAVITGLGSVRAVFEPASPTG